jgi:hypothetical protein
LTGLDFGTPCQFPIATPRISSALLRPEPDGRPSKPIAGGVSDNVPRKISRFYEKYDKIKIWIAALNQSKSRPFYRIKAAIATPRRPKTLTKGLYMNSTKTGRANCAIREIEIDVFGEGHSNKNRCPLSLELVWRA